MANRYRTATGNWSSAAQWDGGVSVPGPGDVCRPNGFTCTIDTDITVGELRTDASSPAAAGGGFVVTADNISITASLYAGTTTCLTLATAGITTTVTGNLTKGGTANAYIILMTGGATLNVVGNVTGGTSTNGYGLYVSTNPSIVNITGNVYGGSGVSATGVYLNASESYLCTPDTNQINLNGDCYSSNTAVTTGVDTNGGQCRVTVNGNCYGQNGGAGYGVRCQANYSELIINGDCISNGSGHAAGSVSNYGTVEVNGDLYGGVGYGLNLTGYEVTAVVNGDVYGGSGGSNSGVGLSNALGSVVTVNGDVYSGSRGSGLTVSSGQITVNGNIYNQASLASNIYGASIAGNAATLIVNGDVYGCSNVHSFTTCVGVFVGVPGSVCRVYGKAVGGLASTGYGVYVATSADVYVREVVANDYPNSPATVYSVPGLAGASPDYCTVRVGALTFGSGGLFPFGNSIRVYLDKTESSPSFNFVSVRESNAAAAVLIGDGSVEDYPLESDVREGIFYDYDVLTGTMKVPGANSVKVGVSVDDTVGTSILNQQSVADAVGPLLSAMSGE